MTEEEKQEILAKTQDWFHEIIAANHIKNTKKLIKSSEFNINPFLAVYLANFLCGDNKPESIAKALIYPRALGSSITTSFGSNMQKFITDVLSSYGSTTSGIDIEFIDQLDGEKKYCQLKAGPQTINKDDVETIAGHFKSIKNLSRTNNLKLGFDNLIVGIIYGEPNELSANYKNITKNHGSPVFIGQKFWTRLTGDKQFYFDLISSIGAVAKDADFASDLEDVIQELAQSEDIVKLSSS